MVDVVLPALDAGSVVRPRRFMKESDGQGGDQFTSYNAEHPDQRAELLAALEPLIELPASGKIPVTKSFTAVGQSDPFIPAAGRPFNVTISGGTGVVAQVERSFGGATWFVVLTDDMRQSLPPSFALTETEVGVSYRINVTAMTSGTVVGRISQ